MPSRGWPNGAGASPTAPTIELSDELHRAGTLIARDRHQTRSRTVASLLGSALAGQTHRSQIEIEPDSGLPALRVGRRITAAELAAVDEDG